jgi:hypothetical protein
VNAFRAACKKANAPNLGSATMYSELRALPDVLFNGVLGTGQQDLVRCGLD